MEERVELNLHTKMSNGLINPEELIKIVASRGYKSIAVTDENSVQAFPIIYRSAIEYNKDSKEPFKVLYGAELSISDSFEPFKITVLVRNQKGLKHLYELITLLHTKYLNEKALPLEVVSNKREGLLIGSTANDGEIERLLDQKEEIAHAMSFYDYIEVCSTSKNQNRIKRIVEIASKNKKLVIATGNVYGLTSIEKRALELFGKNDSLNTTLFSTKEMLEKFSFLGKNMASTIVVTNTNIIKNLCEEVKILPDNMQIPQISKSNTKFASEIYQKAHLLYGVNLPEEVNNRIALELYGPNMLKLEKYQAMNSLGTVLKKTPKCKEKGILGSNHGAILLMMKRLIEKSLKMGYKIESRGTGGSSFIAYLLGLTLVNPLSPHYHCQKCKYTIFSKANVSSGFELEDMNCPNCGIIMKKDGHNIPYASFLGLDASNVPVIDINFSDEIVEAIKNDSKKIFGKSNVFSLGVISTLTERQAYLKIKQFCNQIGLSIKEEEQLKMAQKLIGVKNKMGIYPSSIFIIPNNKEITDFTPVEMLKDHLITHFDCHDLMKTILKFGLLGHTDPTMLHVIEAYSNIDIMNISFDDKNVFELLERSKDNHIGILGIPDFSVWSGMKELKALKKIPQNFSECVKILGLSHGTDVWEGNALELLKQGIPLKDVIAHREDIMNKLLRYSIPYDEAFKIMEFIGKGKCQKEVDTWKKIKSRLQEVGIEEWYITSCEKIHYLFPKAHHVSYMIYLYYFMYIKRYEPYAFYKAYFYTRSNIISNWWKNARDHDIQKEITALKNKDALSYAEQSLLDVLEVALEALTCGYQLADLLSK